MEINLKQMKTNQKSHEKYSGFVVSKFVKTCDELVIGAMEAENHHYEGDRSEA